MERRQIMQGRERILDALKGVIEHLQAVDLHDPGAATSLNAALPLDAPQMQNLATLVREGIEEGWLCEKEANGVRFCRVAKPDHARTTPFSVDAVHMNGPGPGHTHPLGEVDLCFAVSGHPTFDGQPPGWVVYPPDSWHVPTVAGGVMDILYFLPSGELRFGPRGA